MQGTSAALWFLVLLIGLEGCSSTLSSVPRTQSENSISISPTSTVAGSPDLTISVTGFNFLGEVHKRSQVIWSANGSETGLATTFVSSTQLSAVVPAALLSNPVAAQVSVQTGDLMADGPLPRSAPVTFNVITPLPGAPLISAMSPTTATAGSADVMLSITGSNFIKDQHHHSVAVWSASGVETFLATNFVSSTERTAVIPAALLTTPVLAQVRVENWDNMGDVPLSTSNSVSFTVTP